MEDWINNPEEDITVPQVGGIAKTYDGRAIAFVGFDPDAHCNVYSWSQTKQKWQIESDKKHQEWRNIKGSIWDGQYRPSDIQSSARVQERCTTYTGKKLNGPRDSNPHDPVTEFKT